MSGIKVKSFTFILWSVGGSQLFKSFEFGNGSRMSDKKLGSICEAPWMQSFVFLQPM